MSEKRELSVLDAVDTSVKYAYVLLNNNPRRGGVYDENGRPMREQEFKTSLNILFESSINWPGGIDPFTVDENGKNGKNRPAGKYFIRFYDGCTTLFKDNQPQDKASIEALQSGTVARYFNYGYFFVEGFDKMLKLFMDWTSLNEYSPYRNKQIFPRWKSVLPEKQLMNEGELLDLEDKATELAKSAKVEKMMSHAAYLDIPLTDSITGVKYSDNVVRIAYRKKAKEQPAKFIASYSDSTMELKWKIKQLIFTGKLSTSVIPNMLSWSNNGQSVINISGLSDVELIVNRAAEFAQTEDGKEFAERVNSISI